MNDIIRSNIVNLVQNLTNPQTGVPFKLEDEINIVTKNGHVNISITIDPKNVNLFENIKSSLKRDILSIQGVLSANVILTSNMDIKHISKKPDSEKYKTGAKYIVAIASGKGGVGKSTVAVNLAVALNKIGKSVSLLDADIYGPSIPKMMGISDKPNSNNHKKLIPLESYGVRCMSIGFLVAADTPTIWRGPMIMKALEQLFINVDWGESDYMIVDLPPGTGDTQLTMAQKVPLKGAIIVSTPQDVALIDARKGINMFKKVNVPVIGLIENMSYFICNKCKERHEIFSHGGARNEAQKLGTNFLGEIPLDTQLRICSDQGKPLLINEPENEISKIYKEIAKKIIKHSF